MIYREGAKSAKKAKRLFFNEENRLNIKDFSGLRDLCDFAVNRPLRFLCY